MKLSLRKKITAYSLCANFVIAVLLGIVLYKYGGELYYQSFIDSKESLARSIALAIDGDKHKTFTSLKSAKDGEYQKYLRYLNKIRINEDYISYMFTLNYDRKNDRLTYIIDSDILETDTVWITTEFFGLALFIGNDDKISIKYNEVVYKKDFDIRIGNNNAALEIREDGVITLGDKELARVISKSPLMLEAAGKKLSILNREFYSEIYVDEKPVELYCSFTAKGESQSMPGEFYAESKGVIERCKEIINSSKNTTVKRDFQTSIYGENTTTVYGIITDSKGVGNGLVVIELFHKEVSSFKKSMLMITLIIALIAFITTIILTLLLAEYIINPIRKLTNGAKKVSEGDLEYKIKMRSSDEFGVLADTFNSMVDNLKKAYTEITSSNEELNGLKNNLEVLVDERTKELKKSNIDLNIALSEVSTLKGLLPICSSCKKIRDDNGYWNQIENYISTRSQAEFTHSICPGCAKNLYPDIYNKKPV